MPDSASRKATLFLFPITSSGNTSRQFLAENMGRARSGCQIDRSAGQSASVGSKDRKVTFQPSFLAPDLRNDWIGIVGGTPG